MNFETVNKFEEEIAKFFGSPYAIAVDSCTHGVELSLRYNNVKSIIVPKHKHNMIQTQMSLNFRKRNYVFVVSCKRRTSCG